MLIKQYGRVESSIRNIDLLVFRTLAEHDDHNDEIEEDEPRQESLASIQREVLDLDLDENNRISKQPDEVFFSRIKEEEASKYYLNQSKLKLDQS